MSNKMPDRRPECQLECQSIFLAERMPGRFFRSALFKWIFWFFAGTTCFPSLSASTLKRGHGDPAAPGKTRSAKKAEPKWWPETKSMGMSQK